MPIPLSASALHIRDAEGLSLPSVKPCENTPQPFTGPSGQVEDAGEQFAGGTFERDFFGAGHGVPFRVMADERYGGLPSVRKATTAPLTARLPYMVSDAVVRVDPD